MSEKKKIARSASLMSIATFISRILGFIRDMVIARYFGASLFSDAFFAAFKIPNLFRELFAEGAMSAAFIPVLTEYDEKHGGNEAEKLVQVVFTFVVLFVGGFCVLGIFFAPAIVSIIVPGFIDEPAKFDLTVKLTRIMFPFLFLVSLAAVTMGSLNTRRVFFVPALSSAWFNATVIITIILMYSRLAEPVVSAAIGVTAGGAVQLMFQVPSFYRSGFRFGFLFEFAHQGLKRIGKLIVPASLSMGVAQLNALINYIFASLLAAGSITYLYLGFRLIHFPIGIFAVALSTAILPSLSLHATRGDMASLRKDYAFSLRLLFFIAIPSMAGLIALREPIVNLLFQRGEFDQVAMLNTSDALLYYSLGIWAISGSKVTNSAFYSLHDTKTPFKIFIVAVCVNVVCSYTLMQMIEHRGIALANSLSSFVNFTLLLIFLNNKIRELDIKGIASSFMKALIASLVMGYAGSRMLISDIWQQSGMVLDKVIYLSLTIVSCMVIYIVLSYIFKSEELKYLISSMRDRRE